MSQCERLFVWSRVGGGAGWLGSARRGGCCEFYSSFQTPFAPASLLCIFSSSPLSPSFFFVTFLYVIPHIYRLYYMVIKLAGHTSTQHCDGRRSICFTAQSSSCVWICRKVQSCNSTNCNSAVCSYRKEAGCIVTLTSWCNAPRPCSHNHSFPSFKGTQIVILDLIRHSTLLDLKKKKAVLLFLLFFNQVWIVIVVLLTVKVLLDLSTIETVCA